VSARPLPLPINPALLRHADQRRQHLENRIADQITRFAGSMLFVYLHIIWFATQILELPKAIHALDTTRSPTSQDRT
jgi:hypothetical protein